MGTEKVKARLSYKKMTNFVIDGDLKDFIDLESYSLETGQTIKVDSVKEELINRHGYVDENGRVWIYYSERTLLNNTATIPWFTINDGELLTCKKILSDAGDIFIKENVRDLSLDTIKETTEENEELYNEDELKYLNAATSVYTPTINEEDDFLKKMVKTLLLILKININRFTPQFKYKYTLTNLKTALQNKTKMSVKVFAVWMELLHCNFTIIIRNDGTIDENTLDGYIVYNSKTNEIKHTKEIRGEDIE